MHWCPSRAPRCSSGRRERVGWRRPGSPPAPTPRPASASRCTSPPTRRWWACPGAPAPCTRSESAGGQWAPAGKLVPATPEPGTLFGFTLARTDGAIFVGAQQANENVGQVHVFRADGAGWRESQVLSTKKNGLMAQFGGSIAAAGRPGGDRQSDERLLRGNRDRLRARPRYRRVEGARHHHRQAGFAARHHRPGAEVRRAGRVESSRASRWTCRRFCPTRRSAGSAASC